MRAAFADATNGVCWELFFTRPRQIKSHPLLSDVKLLIFNAFIIREEVYFDRSFNE
jgi:hypothetical protein